ncbi:MAG: hypothetical protein SXQ77_04650, partial [Halobacteria archaeon]|nr:hypothetical protein [Halobacteria archaeon]
SADVFENLSSPIKSDNYDKFHEQLPDEEVRITEKIVRDELEFFGYELVHSEEELDSFNLDTEKYRSEDKKLTRKAFIRDWKQSPREQIKRQITKSFAGYMVLRYGVLETIKN